MKISLEEQEARILHKLLEGNVGDMSVLIRHTKGYEAKEDLKRKRRLMRKILKKLMTPAQVPAEAYGELTR